jgi:hypothetical protein
MGFFSVIAAPYIAASLPNIFEKYRYTPFIAVWLYSAKYSLFLIFLIPATLFGSYRLLPAIGTEHYMEKTAFSSLPAIKYVFEHYAGKRVLNDWFFGGRMIYESKGTFPVFIDGRAGTVYTEKILSDYIKFLYLQDGWQEMLQSYGIEVIFVYNDKNFVKEYNRGLHHEDWKLVYEDHIASVYERRK